MELVSSARKSDLEWAARIKELVGFAHAGYEDAIENEMSRYAKEKITIAVIGLMKRGKSTFCNAFLNRDDDDLAPIGKFPATGIISKYCSHPARRDAEVRFADGETLTIEYSQIRHYVTEEYNPENKKKVDFVTIYGDFGFDDDVELMDMPGDGSIHAYHTEIVYRYLPQADVIIFLSDAQNPIQKDELSLLKKVNRDLNNIFFVINKVDKCDEDELVDAEDHDRKVLENAQIDVRKLYKISAREVLEGKPSPEYLSLLEDIRNFLKDNKIDLLRAVFIKRILDEAAPALNMLGSATELKKIELSDLTKALDELKGTSAAMKEQAAKVSSSFAAHWKRMVDEFAGALPAAEEKVQTRVAEQIKNYPALSINRKMLDKLPEMISSIIEDELSKPTQAFEKQVRDEIAAVNRDFPSISKYLSDDDYRIKLQNQLGFGAGTSILGGIFLSGSTVIGGSISTVLTGVSALTIGPWAVGESLAGILGILASPLTALAVIGMAGGALLMALPVFGWIRGKNQQKKQILDSARASIENAFRSMRLQKIPELSRKADELIKELNAQLEKELAAVETRLNEAVEKKKLLGNSIDDEAFKRDECRLAALKDLAAEGENVLSTLNRGRQGIAANE